MKKVSLFLFLTLPLFIMAQQKTLHKKDIEYCKQTPGKLRVCWNGTYQYYYNQEDKEVQSGQFNAGGTRTVNNYGVTANESFSSKALYKDGKLNGKMNISLSEKMRAKGTNVSMSWSFDGMFANSEPQGIWTIKENASANTMGSANNEVVVKFQNGKIVGYTCTKIENGKKVKDVYVNFDNNGIATGSFTMSDIEGDKQPIVKNGFLTNYFIRLLEDYEPISYREVDPEQSEIISKIIANNGKYDKDDLLSKGYIVVYYTMDNIHGTFKDYLGDEYIDIDYYDRKFEYPKMEVTFGVLRRVKLYSYEDAVNYIDEDLNDEGIRRYYYSDPFYFENLFKNGNTELYLVKADKEKVIQYAHQRGEEIVAEKERVQQEKLNKEKEIAAEKERKEKEIVAEKERVEKEKFNTIFSNALNKKTMQKGETVKAMQDYNDDNYVFATSEKLGKGLLKAVVGDNSTYKSKGILFSKTSVEKGIKEDVEYFYDSKNSVVVCKVPDGKKYKYTITCKNVTYSMSDDVWSKLESLYPSEKN